MEVYNNDNTKQHGDVLVEVPISDEEKAHLAETYEKIYLITEKYVDKVNNEMSSIVETGIKAYTAIDKLIEHQMNETKKFLLSDELTPIDEKKMRILQHYVKWHVELAEKLSED